MRRLLFTLAAVLVGFGATGGPAAAEGSSFNRQVSGPFSGTTVFDFSTPTCSFAHQVYDATYATKRKHLGSFHLDGCIDLNAANSFDYQGTFVMTTPDRASAAGTVSGVVTNAADPGPCQKSGDFPSRLDFTLTLVHGTKKLRHATGTIHLTGLWCSPTMPNVPGPIGGNLAGALTRARTPA